MRKKLTIVLGICAMMVLILPGISSIAIPSGNNIVPEQHMTNMGSQYKGHLRIYIAEIESRWDMEDGAPYKYAFYDFVYDAPIEIPYLETYQDSLTWQGDVDLDNMLILAAVFNEQSQRNYADPPLGRPFDAHAVDAAAGVHPGESYTNVKNEDFTHTVFCEIGTASWCPSCPAMASEVKKVYESGEYPFFFIEMVTDMSSQASTRMGDYSLKWLPTGFYDGGLEVVIGGGFGSNYHKNIIEQSGKRDVHDLDLTLQADAVGNDGVAISISITNNEALPNAAPDEPTINGPTEGKAGQAYQFDFRTTDPEDDSVYYMIDWGDGTITDWLGPYDSGETATIENNWDEDGVYIVKVKAKDVEGLETEWVWHKISMPKQKMINYPFVEWLLAQFPLLEKLFF
jgi:thiol-disulfide isomerase/thioredoxin